MATGEINPKEYNLLIGAHTVKGFMPGTSITTVYDANIFNFLKGSDEEAGRILTNNQSVLLTFILMQTSGSNDFLSVQANLDQKTGGGAFLLLFKDNWGNTVGTSAVAWIEKRPDQTFDFGADAAVQGRSWLIRCPHYEGIIGSSRRVSVA